jgi:hypothetical protein
VKIAPLWITHLCCQVWHTLEAVTQFPVFPWKSQQEKVTAQLMEPNPVPSEFQGAGPIGAAHLLNFN